jgi:hypothetical protein
VLAALTAIAFYVLSLPPFGARASGERLARIHASPAFRDGHFVNANPETPTDFATTLGYLKDQFGGNEVRVPPAPIPVVSVDPGLSPRSAPTAPARPGPTFT